MEVNTVVISGNLTKDPELRYTPENIAVCSFVIGHNKVKYVNNEKTDELYFFMINTWDRTAENVCKYLKKGDGVIVEGWLRQERWEKDDGTKVDKVRIVAKRVNFYPKRTKEDC